VVSDCVTVARRRAVLRSSTLLGPVFPPSILWLGAPAGASM
jgi:hypothetical protein